MSEMYFQIVWAVMHEDGDGPENSHPLGQESLRPLPSGVRSTMLPSAVDISFSPLQTSHSTVTTPSQRQLTATQRAQPTALFSDKDCPLSPPSRITQDTQPKHLQGGSQEPSYSFMHEDLASDSEKDSSLFHVAKSPETLVQMAKSSGELGADSGMSTSDPTAVQRLGLMSEADGRELEAEDVNILDPVAALSKFHVQ